MKNLKKYFKGFTLVELIIVITILAILATIAFVSFQNYTRDARDANRTATIKNIEKGLELFTIKTGNFPTPDESTTFTGGLDGKVKINQGIVGDRVATIINMNTIPLDPNDKSKYTYSTFGDDNKYYQVAINSENTQTSFIPQALAFTPKSAIVQGNYKFDPSLPSLIVVPGSINTASGIFDPKVCFVIDGGQNSLSSSSGSCLKKEEMSLKDFDNSLVGYWDMESLTSDEKLKDLSGNNHSGSFSGIVIPQKINSNFGNAYYFGTGSNDIGKNNKGFIQVADTNLLTKFPNGLTVSTIVKTNIPSPSSFILMKSGKKVDNIGFITGSVNDSNKIHWYDWGAYLGAYSAFNENLQWYVVNKKIDLIENIYDIAMGMTQNGSYYNGRPFKQLNRPFLLDDNYHVITMSVDGLGNTRKIYFDGKLIHTHLIQHVDIINQGIDERPGDFFIGVSMLNVNGIYSSYSNFNGIIDEIKIYNRVLTDEEIKQQAKIAGF